MQNPGVETGRMMLHQSVRNCNASMGDSGGIIHLTSLHLRHLTYASCFGAIQVKRPLLQLWCRNDFEWLSPQHSGRQTQALLAETLECSAYWETEAGEIERTCLCLMFLRAINNTAELKFSSKAFCAI